MVLGHIVWPIFHTYDTIQIVVTLLSDTLSDMLAQHRKIIHYVPVIKEYIFFC